MLFEYEKENLLNTAKYADQILLCFEFSYELPSIWGIPLNWQMFSALFSRIFINNVWILQI